MIIKEGRRVLLATMEEDYLPLHVKYLNDPQVNRYIASRPPFSLEQQREWLAGKQAAQDLVHAILLKDAIPAFIGVMELGSIDRTTGTAISASIIGARSLWGQGIAREARLMQLHIAFRELGLIAVLSKTVRPNVRSRRFLESVGYEIYHVAQDARTIEGTPQDELWYCVTPERWLPHWERYRAGS